jgi:hypothetical protein
MSILSHRVRMRVMLEMNQVKEGMALGGLSGKVSQHVLLYSSADEPGFEPVLLCKIRKS